MRQTAIEFTVDGVPVDGIMGGPDRLLPSTPGVVVCHEHPLFGGGMESAVVQAVCRELARLGIATLRFNFRRTAGEPGDGANLLETASRDVIVAFDVIRQWEFVNPRRCGIAGYSFGAAAILRSARRLQEARALALIAPPLNALRASGIGTDPRPLQIIAGDNDRLVSRVDLESVATGMAQRPEFNVIRGANHAFRGQEQAAASSVGRFMARVLGARGNPETERTSYTN